MPDAELKRIIDKAVAAGYDDDDIRLLAQEHQRRAVAPAPKTGGVLSTAADVGIGAAKGVGSTAFGLGKIVHDYTPIGRISDAIQPGAFETKPDFLTPTNTAQRIGYGVEQIGEFFVPVSKVARIPKTAEALRAAGTTMAQTGSPVQAGVSGAITAAIPGGSAVSRASQSVRESAQKTMAQALGATKEWAKSEAAKLAPQMLQRGVKGSRAAMLSQAKTVSSRVGGELNAAYTAAAAAGETVPGLVIRGHVQIARDALKVRNAAGNLAVIPGTERVVQQLDNLDEFIGTLGDDIPIDKAAHLKRTWDGIVSKAGLFGPKATASATDSADAFAIREASGVFRELLNRNPTIAELNKELGFWVGLKNVLKETQKRTQAQSGGLVAAGMGGSGAVVGAMSGDSLGDRASKAVLGGLAGRQVVRLLQSPGWRTAVSGPAKQKLADALATGRPGAILNVVGRLTASLPAQLRTAPAQ